MLLEKDLGGEVIAVSSGTKVPNKAPSEGGTQFIRVSVCRGVTTILSCSTPGEDGGIAHSFFRSGWTQEK